MKRRHFMKAAIATVATGAAIAPVAAKTHLEQAQGHLDAFKASMEAHTGTPWLVVFERELGVIATQDYSRTKAGEGCA